MRAIRLLIAKLTGRPIGEWQTFPPAIRRDGNYAWRLLPDGSYAYRPMTDAEQTDYVSREAW